MKYKEQSNNNKALKLRMEILKFILHVCILMYIDILSSFPIDYIQK